MGHLSNLKIVAQQQAAVAAARSPPARGTPGCIKELAGIRRHQNDRSRIRIGCRSGPGGKRAAASPRPATTARGSRPRSPARFQCGTRKPLSDVWCRRAPPRSGILGASPDKSTGEPMRQSQRRQLAGQLSAADLPVHQDVRARLDGQRTALRRDLRPGSDDRSRASYSETPPASGQGIRAPLHVRAPPDPYLSRPR